MANELDDAFDALPEAPAPASDLDAEFDSLPESPSAQQAEPIAPSVTGFDGEDLTTPQRPGPWAQPLRSVQDEEKAARHYRLKLAFDAAQEVGDRAARAFKVKNALGVKYSEALDNLEGFESAARLADFDPERYEHDNPVLAKLLDRRPELADLVLTSKDIAVSSKKWTEALAWNQRPVQEATPAETQKLSDQIAQQADERNQTTTAYRPGAVSDPSEAERNRPLAPAPVAEQQPQTPEQLAAAQKAFDEDLAKQLAPTKVQELNDPKAKVGRENGAPLVAFLRAKEAYAQREVVKAQISWMLAEVEDGETSPKAIDARGRLDDLKMDATPRAYGDDSGLSRQLSIGIQGGMSTVEMLEGSVKGAGAGAIAGGTIAGIGALALTGSPLAALRSFVGGAEVLAGPGAKVGGAWAAFNQELGPTYEGNRQLITDGELRLTPREAFGAAVLESGMKAGLESLSFGAQTKALTGGLGAMRDRLRGQLTSDPTLRKMLSNFAIEWAKGSAAEGGTGGLQSLVEQIGDYLVKSAKDTDSITDVKWQKGPVVDVRRTLTDAEAELTGGALFGGAAGLVTLGMTKTASDREAHLNQQVPSLLAMAQSEAFQTAPDAFAETVSETTGEHGAPVTAIHIDGPAMARFFQENESDPDAANQKLVELIGPDAPAKLAEAVATEGKVEISLERVPKWAASDAGKALVAATSMDAESLSPEQAGLRSPEIKAAAKRIAAAAESEVKQDAELAAAIPDVEKQLVATGRVTKQEASSVAQIWKAFSTTMGKDFGIPAAALFKQLQVRFGQGDESQMSLEGVVPARVEQPAGPDDLVQFEANLTDERRRELMYLDVDPGADPRGATEPISGLHSRRAWDARIPTPGTQVGLISIPDVKAINDNEKGSHDVTNRLLRLFGSKLGAVTDGRQSARSGTDFLVEVVDQAQLDNIVKELQGVAPKGIQVLGFTGETVKAAGAIEKTTTDRRRLLPESDPNYLPPRGKTAFDLQSLTDNAFDAQPAQRTVPEHLAAQEPPRGEAFVRDVLMSKRVPGARTRAGFYAAGPRKFSASIDMRGLKNINLMMKALLMAIGRTEEQAVEEGDKTGDAVMAAFGRAAEKAGGVDVIFSHMSGDEFAAKADSKEDLADFIAALEVELQAVEVPVIINGVEKGVLSPKFRSGVAEASYGKADQQLNRDKAREPELPKLSPADELRRAGILRERAPGAPGGTGSGPGTPPHPGGVGEAGGDRSAQGSQAGSGAQGSAAEAGDQHRGGTAAGDAGLPVGERQVRDRGDQAEFEKVVAETVAEREARGPLRDEEAHALEQGFNLPEKVSEARESIGRFRVSPVKQQAGESKTRFKKREGEAKRELVKRRAAAEAFLGWVENTGHGVQEEGRVDAREGSMRVSPELLKETEAWARKHTLVDPQSGLSALMEHSMRGTNDYRGPKKKTQSQPLDLAKHNPGANDTLLKMLEQENEPARFNQSDAQTLEAAAAAFADEFESRGVPPTAKRQNPPTSGMTDEEFEVHQADLGAVHETNMRANVADTARLAREAEYFAGRGAMDHALSSAERAVKLEVAVRHWMRTGQFLARPTFDLTAEEIAAAKTWGPLVRDIVERQKGVSRSAILFQPDDKKKPPRGYMMMPAPGRLEKVYGVFLNKRADVSTAIHESGHVFLEMVSELGQRPDAPARLKEQVTAIRGWLGMEESQAKPTKDQHEKFARGFEAYLYEGKAPTEALNKAFTRFKLWLVKIYRSIRSLDVELNDDIRKVFDRLLATDDELQQERAEHGPALFATAEEAGMTPEEFAEYQDDLQQTEEHAKRKAELHVLRERLVETEAWWQRELADVTAKAGEDYERLQARKAQRILGGVDIGDVKAEPVVFDRAAAEQLVGKGAAKRLNTTEENGTHPDEVAEFTGYTTGGEMLAAVLSLPSKDTWVKREAEARMKEQHPTVLDDRAKLRNLVAKGLNGVTTKRLLEERAALRSKGPKGSTSPAPIEALREAARLMVERTPLGQLQPHRALEAERRAANDAVRFAVRGNTEAALEANTRQLLNAAVYAEAMRAAEERDGLHELAKDLSKQQARARAGKASPAFRDAIDFILEATGLKEASGKSTTAETWAKGAAAINDAVTIMEAEEVDVGAWHDSISELLAKGDWRQLTVKEGRTVRDALENLRAGAIQRNSALVDGKKVDREIVAAEAAREIREHRAKQRTPGTSSSDVVADKLGKAWNQFDSFLSNPQDTFRELSNDNPESMLHRAFVLPFQRAKHREADLLKTVIKPILDAFDAMPKDMLARADEKVDGAKYFPSHTTDFLPPRRRHELWMLALNYGNDGNAQRVRDGRNISDTEVRTALDLLTKEELEVIQTILDAHEKLRPEAFDLEEADSGLRPEAVKARPLQLKNGRLKGGYFPIAYESVSQLGKKQEGQLASGVMDKTYGRGATPRGHLKARASEVRDNIITLDPRRLFSNYAQVAHDLAFRPAVRSINALLKDDQVVSALQERIGLERTQEAQQWVKDVAQMRASEVSDTWSKANRWLRGNMAPALLGYYLPNAIGDLANVAAAVASTPLQSKHLAAGMTEFGSSPVESRKVALEKSGELRFMQDQLARDFQKQVKDLSRNKAQRAFAKMKDNAFVFMEGVNVATATPVWIGAYRQALAEGKSEQQAVDFGDDILRRVFPSHSVVDQAAILRDKGFWGTATVFYGYLSVAARATRTLANPIFTQEFRDASPAGKAATAAGVGMRMAGFFMAYQVLGEFLMGRGPEDGDRDEEDPENKQLKWARWMKRKMLMAPISLVPVPGMATAVEAGVLKKRSNPKGDPLGSFIQLIVSTFFDWKNEAVDDKETTKRLARIGALGSGTPIRSADTTGAYVKDVVTGERKLRGPLSTASGLVYGERENQPENVFTVIADLLGEK